MHINITPAAIFLASLASALAAPAVTVEDTPVKTATRSSKRGLIFIPNSTFPADNNVWTQTGTDLTWYYNYKAAPSSQMSNSSMQFVPMLWGAPSSTSDTTFLTTVKGLISGGSNITYVLSFNEPDGTTATGGSQVDPVTAAAVWATNMEPLKALGVKLGAPAVTGANSGFTWLQKFFTACAGKCSADFIPVHWYGNFEGLAGHMGQVNGTYPNMTMWVTEWALDNSALSDTQSFFSTAMEYFDRLDYVKRYSYFGSFRSSSSNVGPNVAMLGSNGSLTDIGLEYLGMNGTGVVPSSQPSRAVRTGGSMVLMMSAVAAALALS